MIEPVAIAPAVLDDIKYVDHLQRRNAEELAFYPRAVFEREIDNRRIILARYNGEPCGYLYHGALGEYCRVHQACIEYDLRGQLYGAALVRWLLRLADAAKCCAVTLRCGSDIAANGFWRAMGFYCQAVTKGGVRRMRDINNWRYDLQPPLLVDAVEPSEIKQDASLWRKRDVSLGSQFLRGRALKEYRARVAKEPA